MDFALIPKNYSSRFKRMVCKFFEAAIRMITLESLANIRLELVRLASSMFAHDRLAA
jgi:hypothetical protein